MISKNQLEDLYLKKGRSMQDIALSLHCSLGRVKYWMVKHGIVIRSASDAMYLKYNPDGDPFIFTPPHNIAEAKLYGMGLGLYWGEGTKANKDSVRLGNTDPELIDKFIRFLETFFRISRHDLRFGLQIFTDIAPQEALDFWSKKLKIKPSQFYRPVITIFGSIGNYRKKSRYGVLTVLYHNKRMRDLLISKLADVAQW